MKTTMMAALAVSSAQAADIVKCNKVRVFAFNDAKCTDPNKVWSDKLQKGFEQPQIDAMEKCSKTTESSSQQVICTST